MHRKVPIGSVLVYLIVTLSALDQGKIEVNDCKKITFCIFHTKSMIQVHFKLTGMFGPKKAHQLSNCHWGIYTRDMDKDSSAGHAIKPCHKDNVT